MKRVGSICKEPGFILTYLAASQRTTGRIASGGHWESLSFWTCTSPERLSFNSAFIIHALQAEASNMHKMEGISFSSVMIIRFLLLPFIFPFHQSARGQALITYDIHWNRTTTYQFQRGSKMTALHLMYLCLKMMGLKDWLHAFQLLQKS